MTTFTLDLDDDCGHVSVRVDPMREDAYWRSAHAQAGYTVASRDYEDYAPAYCVGYTGFAQYGGSFEDAEKSLCANWVRIKGDSQLSYEQALPAIRAAWDRAEQGALEPA